VTFAKPSWLSGVKRLIKRLIGWDTMRKRYGRKKPAIPNYDEKRAILLQYIEQYKVNTLVETGTFLGDTAEFFRHRLDKVYSIELSEELAAKAAKRFEGAPNVRILQGDSGVVLADLVKELPSTALFWLDGHYSSEFYVNNEFIRTARSETDTPIKKELQIVLNDVRPHVILIDDARMFNGEGDYPSLDAIRELVKKAKYPFSVSVKTDIIHIIPTYEPNA
jgi:hypothetical protein